jgi:uncharacterized caspase-like protein
MFAAARATAAVSVTLAASPPASQARQVAAAATQDAAAMFKAAIVPRAGAGAGALATSNSLFPIRKEKHTEKFVSIIGKQTGGLEVSARQRPMQVTGSQV